jgi:UDP-N-acetylglucosamine transferase subunit ALG13
MVQWSICLTVGTLTNQFNRLLEYLRGCELGSCSGLVQYGGSDRSILDGAGELLVTKRYCEESAIVAGVTAADFVISHAGIGSLIMASRLGKQLLLVPRLRKYGEHYDDHQLQICRSLRAMPGVFVVEDDEKAFLSCIEQLKAGHGKGLHLNTESALSSYLAQVVDAERVKAEGR